MWVWKRVVAECQLQSSPLRLAVDTTIYGLCFALLACTSAVTSESSLATACVSVCLCLLSSMFQAATPKTDVLPVKLSQTNDENPRTPGWKERELAKRLDLEP